jgi:hypothetical protein
MMLVVTAAVVAMPTSKAPPCVKYPLKDEIDEIRKANAKDFIRANVMAYESK